MKKVENFPSPDGGWMTTVAGVGQTRAGHPSRKSQFQKIGSSPVDGAS